MSFSLDMRQVVIDLLTQLGNTAVLSKVTICDYDPESGSNLETKEEINTFSTALKDTADSLLSLADNQNFNMSGFGEAKKMIPYQDGYEIDTTWLLNDNQITSIDEIKSQDNVIAYIVETAST